MCRSKPADSSGLTRYLVMNDCSLTSLWIAFGPFLLRYQSEN
jgi:hypothetical protein|eukprot:COSAG06_NODE_7460_length_2498_cov_3.738641_3_plen_42_part_00